MVIAYHVTFAAYGFWLPNDPRGSNSTTVRAEHLKPFGEATFVTDKQSHAGDLHDRALRAAAKQALVQAPVRLTGVQAQAVGAGFAKYVAKSGVRVHACAILPCHVHLVIARHSYAIEQVINLLKGAATTELTARGLHPSHASGNESDRVWGRNQRKVFLFNPQEVLGRIGYVQENPMKEGKPMQEWSFVTQYNA